MADAIYMKGLQFYGHHGVFPEENKLGQRFVVSLVLYCDLRGAAATDNLHLTVNYGEVYNKVREIVEGSPRKLLETVADQIASAILYSFPLVSKVRVRMEKPGAPLPGVFDTVGVEIERPYT